MNIYGTVPRQSLDDSSSPDPYGSGLREKRCKSLQDDITFYFSLGVLERNEEWVDLIESDPEEWKDIVRSEGRMYVTFETEGRLSASVEIHEDDTVESIIERAWDEASCPNLCRACEEQVGFWIKDDDKNTGKMDL